MSRADKLIPKLMRINLAIAILLLVAAIIVFSSGTQATQACFVQGVGFTIMGMFAIEPIAIILYLFWPKGE